MGASLEAKGFGELSEALIAWGEGAPARATAAAERVGQRAVSALSAATPKRSGETAGAWQAAVESSPAMVTLTVTIPGTHGGGNLSFNQVLDIVEGGRGPVEARPGSALFWEGAAHPVKRVGAAAGHPFVDQVWDDVDFDWGNVSDAVYEGFPT